MISEFYQIPTVEAVLAKLNILADDLPNDQPGRSKQYIGRKFEKARALKTELYNSTLSQHAEKFSFVKHNVRQLSKAQLTGVESVHKKLDQVNEEILSRDLIKFPDVKTLEACLAVQLHPTATEVGTTSLAAMIFGNIVTFPEVVGSAVSFILLEQALQGVRFPAFEAQIGLTNALIKCAEPQKAAEDILENEHECNIQAGCL